MTRLPDAQRLALWLGDLPRLEREPNGTYRAEPLAGAFRTVVERLLAAASADPANPQWNSFRIIHFNSDRSVICSAVFKDRPDAEGCVEIGYGLGRAFDGRGYMTEVIEVLCCWPCDSSASATSPLKRTPKLLRIVHSELCILCVMLSDCETSVQRVSLK